MKFKMALCAVMAGVTALTSVVMTVPAAAEESKRYGDFSYVISGKDVMITKYDGNDSYVIVPDEIDGRAVTIIGRGAFAGSDMEYINLPNRLEIILGEAFSGCKELKSVVLPNSVKKIGGVYYTSSNSYYAESDKDQFTFAYCDSLSEFVMGDNVDEIGRATFWYDGVLDNISYSPSINELCPYGYFYALSLADYDKQLSEAYVRNTDHQNVYWTDITVHFPSNEVINKSTLNCDEYDVIPLSESHAKVTFDTNGGDTKNSSILTLRGQSVSEEIPPEKRDCEFVGWYTNPEGKGEPWDFVMDKASSDMTLYAKYRPLQFNVTFDAQGGSCDVKQKDYSFGLAMGELPVPTRTNYQFIGWYTRADGNGDLYTNSTIMPRSDTKLYAAWLQEGKSLVVDFSGNGGELDSEKVLVPYNTAISSFPNATRKGYTFVEWNSKADGIGDTYNKNTKVIHNNLTLYAIWKTKSPTVTLDSNKGTVSKDSFTVKYNTAIGNIPAPKRDGYEFTGWYYQDGRKFSSTDKMPDKDIKLTAKWRGFEYMILFDAKKGTMPGEDTMYASCGDKIGKLPVPVRKGYEFTGWYTKSNGKGTKYTADSEMPEKDLTLYAGWKKITQYATAVKFNAKSVTVGVGESVALNAVTTPVLTLDKLTWSSTNTKVATVSDKGVITGKSAGKATVKVTTSKGKTATIKIVVKKAATSLKVPYSTRTIKTGQTVKATATANGYTGTLKWSSSAPAVAKVDQEGNITGLKAGKCVITVKTYNGVQSKITITVK